MRVDCPAAMACTAEGSEHRLLRRNTLWDYMEPERANPFHPAEGRPPLYGRLDPDAAIATVLRSTGWVVCVGAAESSVVRTVRERGAALLLVEPDPDRYAAAALAPEAENELHLVGEPFSLEGPLAESLDAARCFAGRGFPAVFVLQGMERSCRDWLDRLAETLEVYHYRRVVFRFLATRGFHDRYRAIPRGLSLDQITHVYENLPALVAADPVDALRGAFQGGAALVCGAGPALDENMELVRRFAALRTAGEEGRRVLIAVNNGLKPLLAAGVRPDFVVVLDSSLEIARSFEGLEPQPETALVTHVLATTAGGKFGRTYLFGEHAPDLLGRRADLEGHASVLSAGFSLARLMGCARVALAGAQFCSPDPWSFRYARDTVHGAAGMVQPYREPELTGRFPQLYPVRAASGALRFTTPSFLSAAHYLRDMIRAAAREGVEVINTTADTIIYGKGVRVAPDWDPAEAGAGDTPGAVGGGVVSERPAAADLAAFARSEAAHWRETAMRAREALRRLEQGGGMEQAVAVLQSFDAGNISHYVERSSGFDPGAFARLWEEGSASEKKTALIGYFRSVLSVSAGLQRVLGRSLAFLEGRGRKKTREKITPKT